MFTLKTRMRRALFLLLSAGTGPLGAQLTESPQTVAPGRVLVRMDGLKLSFDRADAAGNTYNAIGALEAASSGLSNSAGSMGVGALWRFTKNLLFDYELQRGLGDRAPEWTHIWRVNWEW